MTTLKPIEKFGLERSLYAVSAVALAAVLATTIFVADRAARAALEGSLRRRGETRVRQLATELEPAVARDDAAVAAQELQRGVDPDEGAYAIVLRADGSVLARRVAPGWNDASERVSEHLRRGDERFFEDGAAYGFSAPIPARGEQALAGAPTAGQPRAQVLLGLSSAPLDRDVARVRLAVGLALAAGVLGFAALAYAFTHRLVFRPILDIREVARRVSERDLRARAARSAAEEVASLAESLNRIGDNLTGTVSRVNGVADAVNGVIARVSKTGSAVAEGVGTVSARVVDTGSSMGEMIASLKGIAANVEVLAQSAEQSSASILEMAATNDEVAENIRSLAVSVSETTAAIEEMAFSIKEVAKNIEDLSATAEETSASMNQIDLSISQVETNANETAKLSEQAQKDAESGAEALSRTLAGIDKIKDSSKEAASVIEALGKKIATVDTILNVIDDVAEQTNLLALNAAILAAQSGEHGKGFAVVADEIKDLAERTGASTKEISEVVRSVQDESKNAVLAMDRGVKNVEEGVRLGQDAETALKKIQESSQKSTQMVKAIARATIEQARGSKQVTMAINRIAETVQQIATATAEQARGSEQIMKSAEKMKIITKHVERSSQEQARGSRQVTKAIESISEMVNHLNRAQKEQTKGSEQVMTAVVQIKKVAEAQTDSVRELEAALIDLAQEVDVLTSEARTFKIEVEPS